MQLHALLAQTNWPDVRASLLQIYPACAHIIDALAAAYTSLGTLTPAPCNMCIMLEPSHLPDEEGTAACVVYGRDGSFSRDRMRCRRPSGCSHATTFRLRRGRSGWA